MMTIWKSVLSLMSPQTVRMPEGAEILCAREQHEEVCIWFKCDPNKPPVPRKIIVIGTGHQHPEIDGRYLGTASLQGGTYMFHVFERTQ